MLMYAALSAFLLMLGLSVLFPVLPFYVRWLELSEAEAGVLMSSYAAVSVVASPLWGRFADARGRKPAIMIGLLGFATSFLAFGLGSSFAQLLAARVVGGVFAAAALPAILAYSADVSAPERRSTAMGMIGAAIGMGIVAGPVFGGLLAPLGLRVPFFVSAAIGVVATALVGWRMREPERHVTGAGGADWQALGRLGGGALAVLAPLLAYGVMISASRVGFEATLGFLLADRFGAGPAAVGGLLGGTALAGVALQAGGIRLLARRFSDLQLMRVGTLAVVAGLGGLAVAQTWTWLVTAGLVLALGYALVMPTFTALVSHVGEGDQGGAQGLGQSAQSIGRVVGPVAFTWVYQRHGGTACYAVAAALGASAWAVSAFWVRAARQRSTPSHSAQK